MKLFYATCRPSLRPLAALALMATVAMVGVVVAQQLQMERNVPPAAGAVRQASESDWDSAGAVLIGPSAPIMNLFNRAEEGISRRDWKFAIDSLQRVIDDPDGSLLPRYEDRMSDILTFESTRLRALRRLLALPPEALTAYRMLYDGKAKGLYERAVASGSHGPLREIVDRYLLTRYGDAACDRLASWLLDAGQFGETIDLLQDCLALVPDGDVPRELLVGKLTAALAATGRTSEARAVVDNYAGGELAEAPLPEWLNELVDGSIDVRAVAQVRVPDDEYEVLITPTDRGTMPPVDPTLINPVPWRYELPWRVSELWARVAHEEPDDLVALPTIHAATDGRRLFVRRPLGIAALDLDDLGVIWETVPWGSRNYSTLGSGSGSSASGLRRFADREKRWSLRSAFEDYLVGTLSLAENVLLTIEWRDPAPGQAEPAQNIQRVFRPGVTHAPSAPANRLIAFDPESGAFLWNRGRTLDPTDPLGQGEFRATPIGVNGKLWVPYLENSDLYLAVLEPADGALRHRILLGSLGDFDRLHGQILPPAYADGLVFVPTARGVVFAVNTNTHTLRWATKYEDYAVAAGRRQAWQQHQQQLRQRARGGRPAPTAPEGSGEWLPSPPVVARGLVLLLPRQGGELFALSANRGEFRWATTVSSAAYIIAADGDYVWLGGRSVSCLSLRDGELLWTSPDLGTPTGWAALSGDRLMVPTVEGLHVLDASTGNAIDRLAVPSSQPPLGNLLCVHDSMISIDPSSVRKFPDITRTFESALAQHQGAPTDVRAALRLAWMYLFKDQPATAFETLDALPRDKANVEPRQAAAVSNLMVSALHDMAGRVEGDPETALKLLKRGLDYAQTSADRLRTGLAIAEQQQLMGAFDDAYETLWDLALSDSADRQITVNDVVVMSARLEISHRIRALVSDWGEARVGELTSRSLALVEDAVTQARANQAVEGREPARGLKTLEAIVETRFPPAAASKALFELADLEISARRYERADQLLRHCWSISTSPGVRVAALIRLFDLYRRQSGGLDASGVAILERLAREYRSLTIDEDLAERLDFEDAPKAGTTVGKWVLDVQVAQTRPEDKPAWNRAAGKASSDYLEFGPSWSLLPRTYQNETATAPFPLPEELRQSLESLSVAEPPRMIRVDPTTRSLLGNRALFHAGGDVIYCQEPDTGQLCWQTVLRLPGIFSEGLDTNRGRAGDGIRRAVADGQILVINANEGLYGVGLLTGRRLWVRPYDNPLRTGAEHQLDHRMAARDGLLAAMPRHGYLTLMRMIDGSTVWERDLRGESVQTIEMTSDRVITGDERLQRVTVFDRADGAVVERLLFRQPDPDNRAISVIATNGVLCGSDADAHSDAVIAHSLADGQPLWRVTTPKPLMQLFEPAPGYVGMGLLGGDITIMDAVNGETILDEHLSGAHGVTDAVIVDATVLIQATTMMSGQRQAALIALDLATGAEVWRRTNLAVQTWASAPLDVYKGVTPAVIIYEQAGAGQLKDRTGVALFDVHTGDIRALARDVLPPRSRARINGEIGVWNDALIVGTTLGVQSYQPHGVVRPPMPE